MARVDVKQGSVKQCFIPRVSNYLVKMNCRFCKAKCQKAGRQKNGAQKLYCGLCGKYSQVTYRYTACGQDNTSMIRRLVCESAGIRSISRILEIGVNTVVRKI